MQTNESFSQEPATTQFKPDTSGPQSAPIQLWLVDDNDQLRNTLADLLASYSGMQCTQSFASANAALSALASKAGPDVILLDINIGQENGLDAVRPIRSLSRSTRVLMLTTFFDTEAKRRALEDGASGFLLKHYPLERILDSIRQAKSNPEPAVHRRRPSCDKEEFALAKPDCPSRSGIRNKSWLDRLWNGWN
jgi:DNA-binding NtrC family response regulator